MQDGQRKLDVNLMRTPSGIAIIGATADASRPGSQAVTALRDGGYKGAVFPVNPKYSEVLGVKCYPSITEIGSACDVAVIALPADHVAAAIKECAQQGIGLAVVLSGGFKEVGQDGVQKELDLVATAKDVGVRLIGPNCLGFVNIPNCVSAGFGSILRSPSKEAGPVSAVLQSGGFGSTILIEAAQAGLGFQTIVSIGNEADVTSSELIRAFVEDPQTRVIFAYVEGMRDGREFMSAARYALDAGKPLVVLKGGNTRQGLRAAASHTASMTGSYDVYSAAFRQCGVIEVRDVPYAVDALLSFCSGKLPKGRRVAVIGGSGGSAVNFSDAADEFKLELVQLGTPTRDKLKATLPAIASIDNPVDYAGGFMRASNMPKYQAALQALVDDPKVDQVGLLLATGAGAWIGDVAEIVGQIAARCDKPILAFASSQMTAANRSLFAKAGVPVINTPRRLAASMGRLSDYHFALQARTESVDQAAAPAATDLPAGILDEHAAKQLLARHGIPVTCDVLFASDQLHMRSALKFPVAVKVVSSDIAHKTDISGVKLNVRDWSEFVEAAHQVLANARKAFPTAAIRGVLASEMIDQALETFVGVLNDPAFGPVVVFGLGGTMAELMRDVTYRVAPFDEQEARQMIRDLKSAALFDGFRGSKPCDIRSVAYILSRISDLAWHWRESLIELDINPLLVKSEGEGAVAADALIVVAEPNKPSYVRRGIDGR